MDDENSLVANGVCVPQQTSGTSPANTDRTVNSSFFSMQREPNKISGSSSARHSSCTCSCRLLNKTRFSFTQGQKACSSQGSSLVDEERLPYLTAAVPVHGESLAINHSGGGIECDVLE